MTIWNVGSINIDHVYRLPHLPAAGETLAAHALTTGLGGKGANQSVAAARAGARVHHIGAVGPEGAWARERLAAEGIGVDHVAEAPVPTGHAIINVDPAGENAIVIFPGANRELSAAHVAAALDAAVPGDLLLIQNETSAQADAARIGREKGLRVVYSAAPFDPAAVGAVMPHLSLLVMNEVEAAQLATALGRTLAELPVRDVIVTRGARGAAWFTDGVETVFMPAIPVRPVDTTGAGDCFIGYVAAALDRGMERTAAMRIASAASAMQVTRPGAADAIPRLAEVEEFLAYSASSGS